MSRAPIKILYPAIRSTAYDKNMRVISGGGPIQYTNYDVDLSVGTDNPEYQVQIQKRINATTAYTRRYYAPMVMSSFDVLVKAPLGGFRRYDGVQMPAVDVSARLADDDITDDIALLKIKNKIASSKQDFAALDNLPQDVYEFQKTVMGGLDSIHSLLTKVRKMAGLYKGRRISRRALLQDIADLWLTFSFGINPTINDAKQLALAIQYYLERKDHVKHFGASHFTESFRGGPSSFLREGVEFQVNDVIRRKYSCRFTDAVLFDISSGNSYASFNEQFHLAATDFVPMLWELMPWSWVFDYAFTAGDVITDYFQSKSERSIYALKNQKTHFEVERTIVPKARPGYSVVSMTPQVLHMPCGYFKRVGYSGLPHRMLRFRTSYEINRNLPSKVMNLASAIIASSKPHHFR